MPGATAAPPDPPGRPPVLPVLPVPPLPATFVHTATRTLRDALGVSPQGMPRPVAGEYLVLCVDAMVEGVHFFPQVAPGDLGYKCLAVNLSDLAAMGARPLAATVQLSRPTDDPDWLVEFTRGFHALASAWGMVVTEAEVVEGPLAVTVEVMGGVAPQGALRRDGARPGDLIHVTGTLGDAALAVAVLEGRTTLPPGHMAPLERRLHRPEPRLEVSHVLAGVASAAIDLSDGLAGDLGHILDASGVGATVDITTLPLSSQLRALAGDEALPYAVGGGDDYELCFTVPPARRDTVERLGLDCGVVIACIGTIDETPGLRLVPADKVAALPATAYRHFA